MGYIQFSYFIRSESVSVRGDMSQPLLQCSASPQAILIKPHIIGPMDGHISEVSLNNSTLLTVVLEMVVKK